MVEGFFSVAETLPIIFFLVGTHMMRMISFSSINMDLQKSSVTCTDRDGWPIENPLP